MHLFLGRSGDDFQEIQLFLARFSEIRNFEMTTPHGSDGVVIKTLWESKGGFVSIDREDFGENQKKALRTIWNPDYMAKLEKREDQWYLLAYYDKESEFHRLNNGTDHFLNIFYPVTKQLLNTENIKKVVRISPDEVEYYFSPESEFFTATGGRDKVAVKYAEIDGEVLPVSIEFWVQIEKNKAAKKQTAIKYSKSGLFPIEIEQEFRQAELGINNVHRSKISLINPNDFRSKNDCYLSGYGLVEPQGFSRGLGWTSWLWIFIGIAISSRLLWQYYSSRRK
jgi:hypothetical protein